MSSILSLFSDERSREAVELQVLREKAREEWINCSYSWLASTEAAHAPDATPLTAERLSPVQQMLASLFSPSPLPSAQKSDSAINGIGANASMRASLSLSTLGGASPVLNGHRTAATTAYAAGANALLSYGGDAPSGKISRGESGIGYGDGRSGSGDDGGGGGSEASPIPVLEGDGADTGWGFLDVGARLGVGASDSHAVVRCPASEVRGLTLEETRLGAAVLTVTAGSPAARAGVRPGSVLMDINGHGVLAEEFETVLRRLQKLRLARPLALRFRHGGATLDAVFWWQGDVGIEWACCGDFARVKSVKPWS
ncbi:unnamed protein product, partial [Phaeothamnion confervicola]